VGPGLHRDAGGRNGRMQEPLQLIGQLAEVFETGALAGLHVLVTAGPTQEAIDPVRYLTNHSSGKMGYAVAAAAFEAGARVTLVHGPVSLPAPDGVQIVSVVSAQDMFDAVMARMSDVDIYIGAAAVADYRPETTVNSKIKKDADTLMLTLVRNPDILANVKRRYPAVFCVGFAAETDNLEHHARSKLHEKGVDMIAANWVGISAGEGGFNSDENALRLVWREGELELPLTPKTKLARELIGHIAQRYQVRHKSGLTSDNILRFNKQSDS